MLPSRRVRQPQHSLHRRSKTQLSSQLPSRRYFPRWLGQMIEENASEPVFLGVHWVFDAFAVKHNGNPVSVRISEACRLV